MEKYDDSNCKAKDFCMEITVRYRSENVISATVRDGCCIYYKSIHERNGSEALTKIDLPNAKSVDYKHPPQSEKLLEFTDRILDNMKYGIIFTYDEGDNCVYATRLCNSMVFMYSPQFQTGPDYPVKMELGHKVKVYDFNVHHMSACTISNEHNMVSDPCVFFSVAQKWQPIVPNEDRFNACFLPNKLPLEDCLVSVALKLHVGQPNYGAVAMQKHSESATIREGNLTCSGCRPISRQQATSTDRLRDFVNRLCARAPAMEGKLRLFEERLVRFEESSSVLRNEFQELVREATTILTR